MSKYNHVEFIKQDPVGEVNFIIGKVGRMLYESISTTTSNLVLMFFGGGLEGKFDSEACL